MKRKYVVHQNVENFAGVALLGGFAGTALLGVTLLGVTLLGRLCFGNFAVAAA